MIKLLASFFAKTTYQQLPALHNTLTYRWQAEELTEELRAVMMTGLAKDPVEASAILERHGNDLNRALKEEPRHRSVDWRRRVRAWLMSIEGSQASDPMLKQLKGETRRDGTYTRLIGSAGRLRSGTCHSSGLGAGARISSGGSSGRASTRYRRAE